MSLRALCEKILAAEKSHDRQDPLGFAFYDALMRTSAPELARKALVMEDALKIAINTLRFYSQQGLSESTLTGRAAIEDLAAIEKKLMEGKKDAE